MPPTTTTLNGKLEAAIARYTNHLLGGTASGATELAFEAAFRNFAGDVLSEFLSTLGVSEATKLYDTVTHGHLKKVATFYLCGSLPSDHPKPAAPETEGDHIDQWVSRLCGKPPTSLKGGIEQMLSQIRAELHRKMRDTLTHHTPRGPQAAADEVIGNVFLAFQAKTPPLYKVYIWVDGVTIVIAEEVTSDRADAILCDMVERQKSLGWKEDAGVIAASWERTRVRLTDGLHQKSKEMLVITVPQETSLVRSI